MGGTPSLAEHLKNNKSLLLPLGIERDLSVVQAAERWLHRLHYRGNRRGDDNYKQNFDPKTVTLKSCTDQTVSQSSLYEVSHYEILPITHLQKEKNALYRARQQNTHEQNQCPRITYKRSSRPITGLDSPRGFQEVKVPRFSDNGTGWW